MKVQETVNKCLEVEGRFVLVQINLVGKRWIWEVRIEGGPDLSGIGNVGEPVATALEKVRCMATIALAVR